MSSSCEPRLTSHVSGRHRIFSESDKLGWSGRDFLFGCSERMTMKPKPKPAKKSRPATKPKVQKERLKGWNEIAGFLGQPIAVAQRWARSGMPVTRAGRIMYAAADALSQYRGRQACPTIRSHIPPEYMA